MQSGHCLLWVNWTTNSSSGHAPMNSGVETKRNEMTDGEHGERFHSGMDKRSQRFEPWNVSDPIVHSNSNMYCCHRPSIATNRDEIASSIITIHSLVSLPMRLLLIAVVAGVVVELEDDSQRQLELHPMIATGPPRVGPVQPCVSSAAVPGMHTAHLVHEVLSSLMSMMVSMSMALSLALSLAWWVFENHVAGRVRPCLCVGHRDRQNHRLYGQTCRISKTDGMLS